MNPLTTLQRLEDNLAVPHCANCNEPITAQDDLWCPECRARREKWAREEAEDNQEKQPNQKP